MWSGELFAIHWLLIRYGRSECELAVDCKKAKEFKLVQLLKKSGICHHKSVISQECQIMIFDVFELGVMSN